MSPPGAPRSDDRPPSPPGGASVEKRPSRASHDPSEGGGSRACGTTRFPLDEDAFPSHVAMLLNMSLQAAVPLWIEEFRRLPVETRIAFAHESAQIIAEKGDCLMFRSKKKGETTAVFNALAKGLAALAFSPGGVRFLGTHYTHKKRRVTKARREHKRRGR